MIFSALYIQTRDALNKNGIPDADFEAVTLIRHFFHFTQTEWLLQKNEIVPEEIAAPFHLAVQERLSRRPLQYILGSWEFMGLDLEIGEGVLIPRDDTEVLVNTAAKWLQAQEDAMLNGIDLCAGSGAVALGICSLFPDIQMTAAELSPDALTYLQMNTDSYAEYDIVPVQGDVLAHGFISSFTEPFDFIVSNPPYIQSAEIALLQPEVQREPLMALDGGNSGLHFYENIIPAWAQKLKSGGLMALEIGNTQASAVSALFKNTGFAEITTEKDLAGLDRVVWGIKR